MGYQRSWVFSAVPKQQPDGLKNQLTHQLTPQSYLVLIWCQLARSGHFVEQLNLELVSLSKSVRNIFLGVYEQFLVMLKVFGESFTEIRPSSVSEKTHTGFPLMDNGVKLDAWERCTFFWIFLSQQLLRCQVVRQWRTFIVQYLLLTTDVIFHPDRATCFPQ